MARTRLDGQKNRVKIALFIRNYHFKHGYAPSIRDIAESIPAVGSPSVVYYHVGKLIREKVILMDPAIPRSLRVLDYGWIDDNLGLIHDNGDDHDGQETAATA